jgi:hypothetical protein
MTGRNPTKGSVPPTAQNGAPDTQEARRTTEYVDTLGYRGRDELHVPVDSWFDGPPVREGWVPRFVSVDASRTTAVKVYTYDRVDHTHSTGQICRVGFKRETCPSYSGLVK